MDLHKIPKLCFEGERSWKRGLGCWQQVKTSICGKRPRGGGNTRFNAAESAPLHEFFDLDEKVANEVHVGLMGNNIDDLGMGSQGDQAGDETYALILLRASG